MGKTVDYTLTSSKEKQSPATLEKHFAARAIAYVRVSTQEQEAQGTQEAQTNSIKAFCLAHGVQVEEWYEEQESTLNPERPKFQKLLEQVESGEVTTIVVAALDRFSRDQIETLKAVELIKKVGASFYCIRDNINIVNGKADLATEMVISVMSLFAKNERETIKVRTMEGKQRKQAAGKWVTGQAPFGYELDRQTKILKVNKAESDIVRLIFNLRLDGLGTLRIIKRLNATQGTLYERRYEFKKSRYCKVSQKQRKTRYCRIRHFHQDYKGCPECKKEYGGVDISGTSWSPTLIKKALKNRVYLGEIWSGGKWSAAAHKPIIDKDTFDTVQDILKKEFHHPYSFYPQNPLSGLVECSCGRRMYVTTAKSRVSKVTGKPLKEYWAFTCPAKKVGQCDRHNVPVDLLRKVLFKRVNEIIQSDKTATVVKKVYDRILNEAKEAPPDIKELQRESKQNSQELTRLTRSYMHATQAGIKEEALGEMLEKMRISQVRQDALDDKIKFLEIQAATSAKVVNILPPDQLMGEASRLWMYFSRRPFEGNEIVARMIRVFIKRVEMKPIRQMVVVQRFDEQLLEEPLHKLFQAVLRLQQIGENVPDPITDKEDAICL